MLEIAPQHQTQNIPFFFWNIEYSEFFKFSEYSVFWHFAKRFHRIEISIPPSNITQRLLPLGCRSTKTPAKYKTNKDFPCINSHIACSVFGILFYTQKWHKEFVEYSFFCVISHKLVAIKFTKYPHFYNHLANTSHCTHKQNIRAVINFLEIHRFESHTLQTVVWLLLATSL